jgi:hypothetical protein
MSRFGREVVALVVLGVGTSLIIALHAENWSERAAFACAFGAFSLVLALRELREDEPPDRAWGGALIGLALLIASVVIAVYVVHSWAWLGLAAVLFVVILGFEAWDWYAERHPSGTEEISQDIEEKQHRQDNVIEKTFFHP